MMIEINVKIKIKKNDLSLVDIEDPDLEKPLYTHKQVLDKIKKGVLNTIDYYFENDVFEDIDCDEEFPVIEKKDIEITIIDEEEEE